MMKKVRGIFIFLATLAIFGISAYSFAKNHSFFSSQVNQPSYSTVEQYRVVYDALGGSSFRWRSVNSLEDARYAVGHLRTQIANYRKIFSWGDQTWTGFPWTGSGPENTPTLSEAQNLHDDAVAEIARLKLEYEALGGSADAWTGIYDDLDTPFFEGTPTLSQAQVLVAPLLIARLRAEYIALGGSVDAWTGTYDDPTTPDVVEQIPSISQAQALLIPILKADYLARGGEAAAWTGTYTDPDPSDEANTLTLSEAQTLHSQLITEIARLKTDYEARGGAEGDWTGSYQGTPTLSEAQTLHSQLIAEIARLKTEYEALGGLASAAWTGSYVNPATPDIEATPTLSEAQDLVQQILIQIANYRKLFGSEDQTWTGFPWTGSGPQSTPIFIEARNLHDDAVAEIARLKTDYDARGGLASDWTGSYDNPDPSDEANTLTLSEAQTLYNELIAEITRLKTDYDALGGGSEGDWTGSYQGTPTLGEAQTLHSQLITEIARLKTEYDALGGLASDWTGTYVNPATPTGVDTPTLSEAQALVELLKESAESFKILIIGLTAGIGGALVLGGGLGYWFYRRRQKS